MGSSATLASSPCPLCAHKLTRTIRSRAPCAQADCVFWEKLFAPLLDTLAALVHASTAAAAVGAVGAVGGPPPTVLLTVTRRLDRAEQFAAMASARGWEMEEVRVAGAPSSFEHTRLLRLRLGCESVGVASGDTYAR